ncbi:NEP1-interacting protein 2-like isoform X2 [Eucalyptus grandis]|uniref:NEP1-interacting protein 2-like isoform X2 n=1 Tax=Eucalyptus grandis TaxID=71139 RepID=UPI0005272FE4|nr:NEP1-interacting protein 2-like isoform X2 [Eucalyptus grandis]
MGKVWVRCCDGVSAIVSAVSYAVSVFFLAIVGSTLGAFVGVLIGVNSRKNLFYSMVYGAIAGGTFLTNAFRMSISFWLSDDCSSSNVLQLTDSTREVDAGEFVQQLLYSLILSRLE